MIRVSYTDKQRNLDERIYNSITVYYTIIDLKRDSVANRANYFLHQRVIRNNYIFIYDIMIKNDKNELLGSYNREETTGLTYSNLRMIANNSSSYLKFKNNLEKFLFGDTKINRAYFVNRVI